MPAACKLFHAVTTSLNKHYEWRLHWAYREQLPIAVPLDDSFTATMSGQAVSDWSDKSLARPEKVNLTYWWLDLAH